MENILQSLREGPELKTNLAYKSKIDSRTLARYLPLLVESRLIVLTANKYRITKKGLAFLKQYHKLKKLQIQKDLRDTSKDW